MTYHRQTSNIAIASKCSPLAHVTYLANPLAGSQSSTIIACLHAQIHHTPPFSEIAVPLQHYMYQAVLTDLSGVARTTATILSIPESIVRLPK